MRVSVLWFHDITNNMDKINISVWQTFHIGLCPTRLHNRTFSNCGKCSRTLCMQHANTFFATQQSDIEILTADPIAADNDKQVETIASKSNKTKHNINATTDYLLQSDLYPQMRIIWEGMGVSVKDLYLVAIVVFDAMNYHN